MTTTFVRTPSAVVRLHQGDTLRARIDSAYRSYHRAQDRLDWSAWGKTPGVYDRLNTTLDRWLDAITCGKPIPTPRPGYVLAGKPWPYKGTLYAYTVVTKSGGVVCLASSNVDTARVFPTRRDARVFRDAHKELIGSMDIGRLYE